MAGPQDLKFNPSEPDKNNEYIFIDISPLKVGTPYKFQFQWIFEDQKLNDLVGDNWSATYEYLSKSAAKPSPVTNLTGTWLDDTGKKTGTLHVRFNHDTTLNNGTNNNTGVDKYLIRLTPITNGANPIDFYHTGINKTGSSQVWTLTSADNKAKFGGFFRSQFTVTVIAIDTLNKTESDPVTITSDVAPNPLDPPVITVVGDDFSYLVSWNAQDMTLCEAIYIEEVVSNSLTAPTTGWAFVKKSTDNPVLVPATAQKRWVRAYFVSTNGQQTGYSNAVSVTPIDPIFDAIDVTPPPNVVSVASAWNGASLELTPTFATGDDSVRFLIDLTGVLNSVTTTRTFFVWRSDLVAGKLTLSALDIYNRFGSCAYTSFTGTWKSADKADNINTGTAFSTPTRTSALSGVTPTISASDITALADGFSIKFTLPTGATHAKVYKRATSWGNPSGQPTTTPTAAEIGGSGVTPVYVADTTYTTIYVRLAFSNDCGDLSLYSNELTTIAQNPVTLDTTPPPVPTVTVATPTLSGSKYQAVATITQSAGSDTKEYRLRYKPSASSVYTTELVKYVSTSTTHTIFDLNPSTTYNISVASVDAANNTSAYSTDVNFTTGSLAVDPPATATLTASTAGAVASWTAPSVIRAPISRYKVELYRTGTPNVLVSTEYSFSTNMSFGGLAAGSYYVNVYAEDSNGVSSTARTSSTVSVTGVGTSDGNPPASSPAAIVNPLYGALEVKWTAISNADPVNYEVYLSTSPITSVVPANLALRVTGTFAIIDTLPGTQTPLTYGTTYYVRIRATDADGEAATLGTEGSAVTLKVDNGDIAPGAVRANVIRGGEITGDQINAGGLLSNNVITVGARSAVVINAVVDGTATNITYTTSGNHGFAAGTLVTARFLTPLGFNITDRSIQSVTSNTFTVLASGTGLTANTSATAPVAGSATSTSNTAIKIDATGTGLSANPFKFYSGVGTYADAGTNPGTPFYLDTNGKFSLRDRLYFDGSTLTVNGTINAFDGDFKGAVKVNSGTMLIGKGVNPVNVPVNPTTAGSLDGIYIGTNNYWFSNGLFSVGAANNTVTWNGNALTVTGAINARSGNFQGNVKVTDGSVYSGTEITPTVTAYSGASGQATYTTSAAHGLGTGVVITVSGLTGANSSAFNGTFITQTGTTASTIVANPQTSTNTIPVQAQQTAQSGALLNVSAGYILNTKGLTFGNNTIIDAATGRITTISASIGGWTVDSSKLQRGTGATGNLYAGISSTGNHTFWAGSTTSGGADVAPFWVKPDGSVRASNISLVGSGTTADFINAGSGLFKVTQDGKLTATSADITGKITASSGKIGNINIDSASLYISNAAIPTVLSGDRMIFNAGGIGAYPNSDAATSGLTGTEATQAAFGTANFALTRNGVAMFKTGFIGGWTISSTGLNKSTSGSVIDLNSSSNYIAISTTISSLAYSTGMTVPTSASDVVLWSGQQAFATRSSAAFRVTADGALTATNANIVGKITVTGGGTMSFGQAAGGTGLNGLYIGSTTDYIYDTGNFKFGKGALLYNGTNLSISNPTGGTTTISGTNLVLADTTGGDDGTAGDPTVTRIINPAVVGGIPDGKIVTGRAIWYGGSTTPNSTITSRYAFNAANPGSTQGFVGGVPRYTSTNPGNFSTGDLYMSLV
jgi:hypothetical protein